MSLSKKQKLILNLLLLQEVDEEQMIIRYIGGFQKDIHDIFISRRTEGFFSVLNYDNTYRYM
jgi:hypothetical protein